MLKRTLLNGLLAGTILVAVGLPTFAQEAFDGPTAGPKAAEGKTIVVLAGDLKNGGILGVTTGIEEAAAKIGWTVKVLDGAGSVAKPFRRGGASTCLEP
jgi:ribose transport system substrate-binding protein